MKGKEVVDAYHASVLERFLRYKETGEPIGDIEHIAEWYKREGIECDRQLNRYALKTMVKHWDDLRAAGFTLVEEDKKHEVRLRENIAKWEAEDAQANSTTGASSPAEPSGD